jgi:hypothetical protein
MQETEVGDGRVEARGGKAKVLGVRVAELDVRVSSARHREHLRRTVDPDRSSAARCSAGGHVAGARGDIEDARSAPDAGRIEQLIDEPAGHRAEHPIVGVGAVLGPAPALECVERVRVALGHCGHIKALLHERGRLSVEAVRILDASEVARAGVKGLPGA